MSVPYVNVDKMKRHAINRLSKRFGRTIDVTADLVNSSRWVFTAHLGTGRGYSDDFILYPYLGNLSEYARENEECHWINKFVADVIDYERDYEKMHTVNKYKPEVTERQKEYLNILYCIFDSFANEKRYAFDSETDVERGFVKFIFRNRRGKCYSHVVNINDTRHTNLYPLVHDITVEVDRLLSEDSGKSITEIAGEVIKGEWGNGLDRVKRLTEAGYDPHGVQEKANELMCTMNLAAQVFQKSNIKDVIFNNPATIVLWKDGTKTVVKATEEEYDPEKGLAMAIAKKRYGNKWSYYNVFKHWLKKYKKSEGDYEQVTYTTKLIMEED